MKKNLLLALIAIGFSASLFAAEPPADKSKDNPGVAQQRMHHMHDGNRPMMKGPHPRVNVLFDVTLKSDDPIKTIKKAMEIIPAGKAKQYQVHISVTEVPDMKFEGKPAPAADLKIKK